MFVPIIVGGATVLMVTPPGAGAVVVPLSTPVGAGGTEAEALVVR